ncbi:putative cytokinetic ring protein SteA [Anaerobacillus sp. MEB173]|uniref:putative cytokinetic ring protein SteA n=1 Tax=Anaerobacillus sp. MEB173 TaxID=3383345 RepID=UPI003F90CC3B
MFYNQQEIEGIAYQGKRTKVLAERLPSRSIAVISHEDIDVVAAETLIEKKVQAVLNLKISMTGEFDHNGVQLLLKSNIPVFDLQVQGDEIHIDGKQIKITNNLLFVFDKQRYWKKDVTLKEYDINMVEQLKEKATEKFPQQFESFVRNSFSFGEKELTNFIKGFPELVDFKEMKGKDVLIVARGGSYLEDLRAIRPFLKGKNMVLIAVDGGADGLLKFRLKPDFIIGDMDSVSMKALRCGATLVAHCYPNGHSPASARLSAARLPFQRLPFIGTSEDVALLCAYCAGANMIYLIGSHLSMNEFLEKGRKGMGSSLLTRMKAGHQVIDLKGVHHLYKKHVSAFEPIPFLLPAVVLMGVLLFNPKFELLVSIIMHWLRMEVF